MLDIVKAKDGLLSRLKTVYPNFSNVITPSTLRLSAAFDADVLEFSVKKTEGRYRTDVKLRDGDIFFFNLWSLGWSKTTANNAGKDEILYYPDATFESNYLEVQTQYNGKLSLIEGEQNILIPEVSTTVFQRTSRQQYTETTGTANTTPSYETPFCYTSVGVGLAGNKDYSFKLSLGQGTRDNITSHRSILILDGFVIPSAATSVTVSNA